MLRAMNPEEKMNALKDPNLASKMAIQFARPYSPYTQNNKMSERVSRLLKKLGGSANTGVASYDMEPLLEVKNNKPEIAPIESTQIVETITPDILEKQKINPTPGVAMTPEVVESLKAQSDALANKRIDLERQRRMNEYDQRARARRSRVEDTLNKTGLYR